MNKESLSNAESNNGDDWNEPMTDVQPSGEIDFEQRKKEIEVLKLDIEKAKLEAEKSRAERDAADAGTFMDPINEEKRRARELAESRKYAEEGRIRAEERTYSQLAEHNPERVADHYETHAWLDNLHDESTVHESLTGTNDGNADTKYSRATSADATGALNGLEKRQSGRYSEYQDAAAKHIDNTLDGIDRKLDILGKHNPTNERAA